MYKIAYVERSRRADWLAFWVDRMGKNDPALGRTEFVEASSLSDAIGIVQKRYPDCVVMPEGSGRIGRI